MSNKHTFGTVLVTGGAGWLGSHICEALISDRSFDPIVSSIEPQIPFSRRIPGVTYYDCDLNNLQELTKLLDSVRPRVIIHTIGPSVFAPKEVHNKTTYDLSKQLVASSRKHPSVQALVFTSTAHVVRLAPKHNSRPVREDEVPLHSLQSGPHAYTRTKSAIDILVRENNTPEAFENTSGDFTDQLLTAVLRVTGMYGPRDRQTILEMLKVVNTFKTQFQLGPNKLVHDWIYVESCAQAHVLAAKALLNPRAKRADGEAFSVSDGKPMKFWDFVRKVWEEGGDENWASDGPHKVSAVIPIWLILFAVGTIEWACWLFTFGMLRSNSTWITYEYMKDGCWFDIGKAREVLGYEPMCDTAEGVRRSIQWHKDNLEWDKKLQ